MPFLLPALPAIIGAGGAIGGALLNKGKTGTEKELVNQQVQTEQDQRQLMDQYAKIQTQYGKDAADFYLQYMQQGSPFLKNLLAQHFGDINKQYQDQGGQLQQRLASSGFGAAPSGLAAATMGDLSRAEAGTQSESWLNDMLQNEQLKFQAGQGLTSVANMFQPGQFALHRFSSPQVPSSSFSQVPGAIATGLGGLLNQDQPFGSVGGKSDPALGSISAIPQPAGTGPMPTPPNITFPPAPMPNIWGPGGVPGLPTGGSGQGG